jgi:inosose dehydratase
VEPIAERRADAAKVVKDFLPILKHMHLKDYKGWQYFSGCCPLLRLWAGSGLTAVLDMVEAEGPEPEHRWSNSTLQ